MQHNIKKSKRLIVDLGYKKGLHKVNLISVDGQYVADYEPCVFLRGVIETGRTKDIVDICQAFNAFSDIKEHPFTKFIESTKLYGDVLINNTPSKITYDYENWFEINKNQFSDWV